MGVPFGAKAVTIRYKKLNYRHKENGIHRLCCIYANNTWAIADILIFLH